MNTKTVVSSKRQIVIPKHMREFLDLHYGSEPFLNLRKDNVLETYPKKRVLRIFLGKEKE